MKTIDMTAGTVTRPAKPTLAPAARSAWAPLPETRDLRPPLPRAWPVRDLPLADTDATAAFVMGEPGVRWVAAHPGYDAVAVTPDHRVVSTAGTGIEALRIRDGVRTVSSPGETTVS